MQQNFPFGPFPRSQINVAVTNASQALSFGALNPIEGCSIRVVNDGTDKIAWCFEDGAAAVVSTDVFMAAGTVETFDCPGGKTGIRVIGVTGGLSTIRVMFGRGT